MKNKKRSQFYEIWSRLKKNKLAMFGLVTIILIVIISVVGRLTLNFETDVMQQDIANKMQPPSAKHWFGTDSLGRDIFKRMLYGSLTSLAIGVSVVTIEALIGAIIGAISGFFGGAVDNICMRILDMLMAIPGLLLNIAIVSVLGPSFINLILAMGLGGIPRFARLIRASVLTIKNQEFVEAARAIGCSDRHIIIHEVLPNTFATMMIQVTLGLGGAIVGAAGMSFLGLGVAPPNPEWGAMLADGRECMRYTPYPVLFPGAAIMLIVTALNFLGDGLRDALDPKLKN